MPDTRSSRSALGQWATARVKSWLRSNRLLLITLLSLLALTFVHESIEFFMYARYEPAEIIKTWYWQHISQWVFRNHIEQYEILIWLPAAAWLGVSLVRATLPPGELAVTCPAATTYATLLRTGRRIMWSAFGVFLVSRLLFARWIWALFPPLSIYPRGLMILFELAYILFIAGTVAALIEYLLALILRTPAQRSYPLLWLAPVTLAILGMGAMSNSWLFRQSGYLSNFGFTPTYPNVSDYWVSLLHFAGLAIGLCCGVIWLRSIFQRNRLTDWLVFYLTLLVGTMLPLLNWLSGNLGTSRSVHSVSALLHGIWLGNPLAGWSASRVHELNPFIFENLMQTQRVSGAAHIYTGYMKPQGILHLPVGPWVCLENQWVFVWIIGYYAICIWVLIRCNNAVPKGYTGSYHD